jgi:hypothetical protein
MASQIVYVIINQWSAGEGPEVEHDAERVRRGR